MATAILYNKDGERVGEVQLPEIAFSSKICESVVHQYLRYYLWRIHPHTAKAKTRAEISGGGKKPWRQKGTGRARVGSIRSPLWRHGGVIFPPVPGKSKFTMPKKMRRVALRSVLSARAKENQVYLIEDFTVESYKTSLFNNLFNKIGLNEKSKKLVVTADVNQDIFRSCRNIDKVCVKHLGELNTYDVLQSDSVVIFQSALPKIEERCQL